MTGIGAKLNVCYSAWPQCPEVARSGKHFNKFRTRLSWVGVQGETKDCNYAGRMTTFVLTGVRA